jgi:outer membrane protein assembly factor BamB/subtilisin family serine protease
MTYPKVAQLRVAFLLALLASVCPGATEPATPEPALTARELARGFGERRILAMPRAGSTGLAEAAEIREGLGVRRRFDRFRGLRVLELRGARPEVVIERLRATGHYEFVEPDYIRIATLVPNDPRFAEQWALNNTGGAGGGIAGADIKAVTAWNTRSTAPAVVVAVIDSGVRVTHQDIAANLWVNPGEVAGNGQDDDANGYVDDVHGINSIVSSGSASSGNPNDDSGHGSHVAGIVGAVGNNGVGISGVAWNVRIMALKFLSSSGSGLISDAIECIDYAIAKGAHVINASYGAEDPKTFSQAELEAIRRARNAGIVFVAAAGNDGLNMDISRAYPASYPLENIIAVGNSTSLDDPSPTSNFGSGAVEIFAPGSEILSLGIANNSEYVLKSGTSMAAPHVSGALALLKAQFPGDNYRGLINRVMRGAAPVKPSFATRAQTRGRLDLNLALTTTTNRPFNDDFANRAIITGSNFAVRASNEFATAESGEPTHAGIAGNRSLWWSWTPSASASVTFDTTGSTIDTLLAIYTGSVLGSLAPVASSDDSTGTTSRVQLNVVAGTPYQIAVDGKAAATGLVLLNIGSVPANDNFSGAQVVTGESVLVATTNSNASRESGEPLILGNTGGRSLWYRWTAPSTKRYQISAYSIDVDTLAAVYTGNSLGSLTLVTSSDNNGTNTSALCTINATAGTTYHIAIDAKESLSGAITFTIVDSQWQFTTGGAITGSPAVAPDGTIYVGSTDGNLYAISSSGAQLWTYQTGGLIDTCSPAIAPDGTIYTGSFDGFLHAVNPNGSQKWRFSTGGLLSNSPAIAADGTIYVKSDDNFLYAISPAGTELWRFNTQGITYASPVVAQDGTIYVGSGNSRFFAVNPNGSQKWQFVADGDTYSTAAIDAAGNIYFGTLTGRLYSLTPAGAQRWSYMPGGPMSSSPALSADGATVYFGAYDHFLHAVNTANGSARWTYDLGNEVRASSPLVAADGSIYIGAYDGRMQAVNADGTAKRFYATGDWIRSCPVIVGTTLYFGSNDNKLYAVPAGVAQATAPWPCYRNNAQRTGRSGIDPATITISQQPKSQIVQPDGSFTLSVSTTGATPTGYQWFKNGTAIPGATSANYAVVDAMPSDTGTYHVVITGPLGNITSASASIVVPEPWLDGRLVNLSVRSPAGTGSSTLIVGFYVDSITNDPLSVLIRGVGPSIVKYNVPGALLDPRLTLFNTDGVELQSNNDWGGDPAITEATPRVGAFAFDSTTSKDAALLASLTRGGYTAHVTAADGGTGIALAEIYDAAQTEPPVQLSNVSARSAVGTGDNVLIVGFAIRNEPRTLLIRGIGPALGGAEYNVPGALADPKLTLYDINQNQLAENDDWNAADAVRFAQAGAFPLAPGSKDAAMIVTLPPGTYSAVLHGVGGTTGIGLVEVYALSESTGAQPAWRDEFYQYAGTGPIAGNWTYDLGGGGWGNQELETYTSDRENSFIAVDAAALDGRAMVIRAVRTLAGTYTSARLKTQGLFNVSSGRIEARMKLPQGQGIWPAFWMLGANIGTVGWPACGEIDIMEYLGHETARTYGTIHGPGYSGASSIGSSTTLPSMTSLADGYHIYAVEWSPGEIKWSLDGTVYFTTTPASLPPGATWAFNNNPHFLLLNLAVGGQWPGNPDSTTVFPQEYRIDYVRVYDLGG